MGQLMSTANASALDVPYTQHIVAYLDWGQRAQVAVLCGGLRKACQSPLYSQWLCRRLAAERYLYVPAALPPGITWGTFFHELWIARSLFAAPPPPPLEGEEAPDPAPAGAQPAASARIKVAARFKPAADTGDADEDTENQHPGVTLPLHQRVQLIKQSRRCTTSQALGELSKRGMWFKARNEADAAAAAAATAADTGGGAGISAEGADRASGGADAMSLEPQVHTVDAATGEVVMIAAGVGLRQFQFDSVLPPRASQRMAYEEVRRPIIDVCNGYNATIICYGQTGSGKTHTMFGPDSGLVADRGIVPRAMAEIFAFAEQQNQRGGAAGGVVQCTVSVSYVQVFGDEVTDLLAGNEAVSHSRVAASRFVLAGECQLPVHSMADVEEALETGDAQKRRAATAMNERSSRAHSLFIVGLSQHHRDTDVKVRSQLFLVDLGGSEQVKKSGVSHGVQTNMGFVKGTQMREAVNINLGLLALKKCIDARKKRAPYVPFQDSKLTMLLSSALGGDSKTIMIICGSMDKPNAAETLQALRFGENCAAVETDAALGKGTLAGVLEAMDKDIKALEEQIILLEHWEHTETVRQDTLLEAGTFEAAQAAKSGGEVVRTSKLVGAESERDQLELLLRKRAAFTGEELEDSLAEHGFGGAYGGKATPLGGHAGMRFQEKSKEGLKIKGKVVAEWQ